MLPVCLLLLQGPAGGEQSRVQSNAAGIRHASWRVQLRLESILLACAMHGSRLRLLTTLGVEPHTSFGMDELLGLLPQMWPRHRVSSDGGLTVLPEPEPFLEVLHALVRRLRTDQSDHEYRHLQDSVLLC